MHLHSRGNYGWISCLSLLACLSLLLLGGGIFRHLYFRPSDPQNSNEVVQNDFLAIEQKTPITPPQPTSPVWKANIRHWADQLPEKWKRILLRIPPDRVSPKRLRFDQAMTPTTPWTGVMIGGNRWVKKQGKWVNYRFKHEGTNTKIIPCKVHKERT